MLAWKDYRSSYMVIPLVGACVDRSTGHGENTPINAINTRYADIFKGLCGDEGSLEWTEKAIGDLEKDMYSFKNQLCMVFDSHCLTGLHT